MSSSDDNSIKLRDLFEEAWSTIRALDDSDESTVSEKFQTTVKECIRKLVLCDKIVKSIPLFSSNESLEEVSTASLRYMLVPVFLGDITDKVASSERMDVLQTTLRYYQEFLTICSNYGIASENLSIYLKESTCKVACKNMTRDKKIERFKKIKDLRNQIKVVQERFDSLDEDHLRQYYLNWITVYINTTLDNMKSIYDEISLLESMKKVDLNKETKEAAVKTSSQPAKKPLVITREMIKDGVFGYGYKSLPTMSEDEYFQLELQQNKVVLDYNQSGSNTQKKEDEDKSSSSDDEDSEEKLQKARKWDEWKDTHRRGEGNKERNG